MPNESEVPMHNAEPDPAPSEGTQPSQISQTMSLVEPLPGLHTPHRRRSLILWGGVALAMLDLCWLPIIYYYAFKFTSLDLQETFGIITGIYGLLSFSHYALRSLKLFRSKTSSEFRPVGWTKWGMFEFLHVNILIVITLFEIELVVGTIPDHPWVRVVAMPSPTICFYFGFLFCGTAILTSMQKKLPFNMSSTPKGTPWRPAMLAFIEDAGAIEGRGGVKYREAVIKRWEVSPRFRRMILILSWIWGLGLLFIAIVATILIMLLDVDVGFGVGWGLPWVWSAGLSVVTVLFVKHEVRKEKEEWRAKEFPNSTGTPSVV